MANQWRRLGLIVGLALLAGCAQNEPYHTLDGAPDNCVSAPADNNCTASYYQDHGEFDLAFAEFSDRGNAFNDKFITDVLTRIERHAEGEAAGAVVITFVHGWKHNANETDSNLVDFKASLKQVAASGALRGRRLIGLYVGWRGASIDLPWVKNVSFWERKAVAEEVGKGSVTRLFLELDRIDGKDDKNVFVVIGHSFGGAIVVSALTEILTARVVQRTRGRHYANSLGDAVIVLNPAIEANQALDLVEASLKEDFPSDQHPLFVSISTDADSATHQAFPLGQTLGLLLTWQQKDLERSYLFDRLKPSDSQVLKEEHLDATTVGNFAPFLTHRLSISGSSDAQIAFEYSRCEDVPAQCTPKGLTSLSGQPAIKEFPENYPLFFIKTDERVMSGHNDIFNQKIKAFMLALINDVVRRDLSPQPSAAQGGLARESSILKNPAKLLEETERLYRQSTPPASTE
ncbi:MAG: hypothetical protein K0U93_13225 [Gammaproteobacteria bacterium]|nr:hypothetical protein [Gammaproteobacteria bacterium]